MTNETDETNAIPRYDYRLPELEADPKVHSEELRRAQIADSAAKRASFLLIDLAGLIEKDLRQQDTLRALCVTGTKLLELGLHTRGRLKAAEGRSDAFLEATAANVKTALRHALSVIDEHDLDLGAWEEAFELVKPAMEDLRDIAKKLERPGVKTAVTPVVPEKPKPEPGPKMFDDQTGEPAPEADVTAPERPALGCVVDAEVVETDEELPGNIAPLGRASGEE